MRRRMTMTTGLTAMSAVAAVLALTACSAGSSAGGAADPAPATSSLPAAAASGAPDFAAYRDCLADNGVTLPEMGAPGGERPSAMPSAMPSGGPGAFPGALPEGVDQEAFAAAQAACADLAPAGGPGGLGGPGGAGSIDESALAAFRSCLSDNGVELAEEQDPLRDLDRSDPAVQSAVDTCAPLLPAPSPAAGG